MSDDGRILGMTHHPLPLGGCRCSTVGGALSRVYSDCPEHGLVARLTSRQWDLLDAVDGDTAQDALRLAQEIPADRRLMRWTSDHVTPVWVIGVGRRWTVTRRVGPTAWGARHIELIFGTNTGGCYTLDVPVARPVASELVDTVASRGGSGERS